ncbi:photosystem I assembly protein Ycf3 [Anthocerotibacter panamensis]|uniref:photosystem I assembly protein Ycf3 n=1 Tax=Anthocerotibacter panamensis TaxID=2857077 RepID=UPI001C402D5A|nr:photosystem I assembly protein Ycf3 [Anthocerotibacter panamensis]
MPRSQRNDNFIDKSFTVMADMILKIMPVKQSDKEAFAYYRDGMAAQADGDYAEALENYTEALKLEENPIDRSYILYNIGLIKQANGEVDAALEYYDQTLEVNPRNLSAMNNSAIIYFERARKIEEEDEAGGTQKAEPWYDKAAQLWIKAVRMAPNNYIEAQNWLKTSGRAELY